MGIKKKMSSPDRVIQLGEVQLPIHPLVLKRFINQDDQAPKPSWLFRWVFMLIRGSSFEIGKVGVIFCFLFSPFISSKL